MRAIRATISGSALGLQSLSTLAYPADAVNRINEGPTGAPISDGNGSFLLSRPNTQSHAIRSIWWMRLAGSRGSHPRRAQATNAPIATDPDAVRRPCGALIHNRRHGDDSAANEKSVCGSTGAPFDDLSVRGPKRRTPSRYTSAITATASNPGLPVHSSCGPDKR